MAQNLAPNSTSISRPITPIDRRLSDSVAAIMNTVVRTGAVVVASVLPTADQRRAIQARLADVRRALLPLDRSMAERERAARAVAAMLSGWVNARVADPAAKVSAYIATLGDLPCWVVEQVCHDVARGHVEGLDPDFPPSAARLHQLGEEALIRLRKEANDLHAVSIAKLEVTVSDEERRSIGVQMVDLSERLSRGNDAEDAARLKVKAEQDAAARKRETDRVAREYAELGMVPPSPLALSITARRELGIGMSEPDADIDDGWQDQAVGQ